MKREVICGIYKITSPSGRIYIGKSKDILKRWVSYRSVKCKRQTKLYNSLLKYGSEVHIFEIVEKCKFEELIKKERYWQEYYKVVEGGLNCNYAKTDEKPQVMSESTKQAMSIAMTGENNPMYGKKGELHHQYGIPRTQEQNEHFSKTMKGRFVGEKSYMFGITKTEEIKDKISQSKLGKKTGWESPVAEPVINTQTEEIYPSAIEAFKFSNMESYDYFKSKLNGGRKNNTPFMYYKDFEKYGVIEPIKVKPNKTEVRDTLTLKKYNSIAEASKNLNIEANNLRRYLAGLRPNTTYCVYEEDYIEGVIHYPEEPKPLNKVIDDLTGIIYNSVEEVSEKTDIPIGTLRVYLSGRNPNAKRNTFKYYKEQ